MKGEFDGSFIVCLCEFCKCEFNETNLFLGMKLVYFYYKKNDFVNYVWEEIKFVQFFKAKRCRWWTNYNTLKIYG